MRPVIGVPPSIKNDTNMHMIGADHLNAVIEAGGMPCVLPYSEAKDILPQIAEMVDGLYLTGGNDIDPSLFGEEPHRNLGEINPVRDDYEHALIKLMLVMNKPILGACKGAQMINIALGGDMYQDIYAQIDQPLLQHHQRAPAAHASHFVDISEGSLLKSIVNKTQIKVNSRHHQANRNPGQNLLYSGLASDGVVEACESTAHRFVLGVQWHPENMAVNGNEDAKRMFSSFIEACR